MRIQTNLSIDESNYTIIQPILSGDKNLKTDLTRNLEQTTAMQFIWLVDQSDKVGQEIVADILSHSTFQSRVNVLFMNDVPEGVNPKVHKVKQAIKMVETDYLVILDDDSVIDFNFFQEMALYEKREDEIIITGIPYNHGQRNPLSKLVASFVNGNSLFTYFGMAKIQQNHTLNGMFYIVKTNLIKKYRVYEEIEHLLCDDFAIAAYLSSKGVKIIQSTIPCNVRTTISSIEHYVQLMKRWLIFANIYVKQHFSFYLFVLMVLPSILPFLLIGMSFFLRIRYFFVVLSVLLLKAIIVFYCRKMVFQMKESPSSILYEIGSDLLLFPLYVYALLSPHTIIWRNKKISVNNGEIHYEKFI